MQRSKVNHSPRLRLAYLNVCFEPKNLGYEPTLMARGDGDGPPPLVHLGQWHPLVHRRDELLNERP